MPPRILILSHDNKIGDAIVATGLLRPLRQRWPDSEIGVLCGPSNAAIYRLHPGVKWLHIAPNRNLFSRAWAGLQARMKRYDIVVDFGLDLDNPSVRLILQLARAKQRYLFAEHPTQPRPNDVVMKGAWYQNGEPDGNSKSAHKGPHFSARHQRFLQEVGAEGAPYRYALPLPASSASSTSSSSPHSPQVVVINSQGSTPDRSLPMPWLRQWVKQVLAEHAHVRIELLSASHDHARVQTASLADLPRVSVVPGSADVGLSLAAIRGASVLVSTDTYAVQAASTWNIPVLALYGGGGTTRDLWAPLSDKYLQLIAGLGQPASAVTALQASSGLRRLLAPGVCAQQEFLT